MRNQKGLTFWSVSMSLIGIVFVAIIGMKLVPAYLEFASVKKGLNYIKSSGSLNQMTKNDIQMAFSKAIRIDNIRSVTPADLEIGKDDSGNTTVSVEYQVSVPMVYNITALLDFSASIDDGGTQPSKAQ